MVFFDNDLSVSIAKALADVGEQVEYLGKTFKRNTRDIDWIPEIASKGWIILTADRKMTQRPAELEALIREKAIIAIFPSDVKSRKLWDQFEWLVSHWRKINEDLKNAKPGEQFEIMTSGQLRQLQSHRRR